MKVIQGVLVCTKEDRIAANLYMLRGETLQEEEEVSVATSSPNERCTMTWRKKLEHMFEQGMKILAKNTFRLHKVIITLL